MIDVENVIFDKASKLLETKFTGITVESTYNPTPSSFPFVSIEEQDNFVYDRTSTLDELENHCEVMYQVDVYSNRKDTAKSEAKKIANYIDEVFNGLKFTRIVKAYTPNVDRSIFRITMRYTAVISAGKASGIDTIYQVYTR